MTPSTPSTPEIPVASLKPTTPGPATPGFGLKPLTPGLSSLNTALPKGSNDPETTKNEPEEPTAHEKALEVVQQTGTQARLGSLFDTTYAPLETWHLRAAIDRAHVNSAPANPQPTSGPNATAQTSTTPDDAFFILHLTLSRAISSGSVACVRRTAKAVRDVVERDLVGVVRRRMEDCWRTGGAPVGKGKGAGEDRVAIFVVGSPSSLVGLLLDPNNYPDILERLVDVCSPCRPASARFVNFTYIGARIPRERG